MARNRSIFNRQALERLNTPDDLEKYVQVTNPSVWVILFACLLLLGGLLAWGIFGTISTSVSAKGVVVNDHVACFLPNEDVMQVELGDEADCPGAQLEVTEISRVPSSRTEATEYLGSEYLSSMAFSGDWNYRLTLEGDIAALPTDRPFEVEIITDRQAPINHLFGGHA